MKYFNGKIYYKKNLALLLILLNNSEKKLIMSSTVLRNRNIQKTCLNENKRKQKYKVTKISNSIGLFL